MWARECIVEIPAKVYIADVICQEVKVSLGHRRFKFNKHQLVSEIELICLWSFLLQIAVTS